MLSIATDGFWIPIVPVINLELVLGGAAPPCPEPPELSPTAPAILSVSSEPLPSPTIQVESIPDVVVSGQSEASVTIQGPPVPQIVVDSDDPC